MRRARWRQAGRWRHRAARALAPVRVLTALCAAMPVAALGEECIAIDWMALPLSGKGAAAEVALEAAYPGSDLDIAAGTFTSAEGQVLPWEPARAVAPLDRLDGATIGDMFHETYPLAFDPGPRLSPRTDPGRARNAALMRALWFDDADRAAASLAPAVYRGAGRRTAFAVTTRHCVRAQLQAALDEIAAHGAAMDRFFSDVGGTFNWRRIAGTDRLSSHAFAIAVDLNTRLGAYWRWAGVDPGAAGAFDNVTPREIVVAMERYGFIWGGKWRHYDSFHFEYRPELILHARLLSR